MGHYAKIEDGVVTQVLVANGEAINDFPGRWVKTSYNTKGGAHYDAAGNLTGSEGIRKNYAAIGDRYDEALDAFYTPQRAAHDWLDPTTCQWIDTRSTAVLEAQSKEARRKSVYVPSRCLTPQMAQVFEQLSQSGKVSFTHDFTRATAAILTSTEDLLGVLEDPLGRRVAPVSWESYQKLFEETPLEAFGVNVLSAQESQALSYPLDVVMVDVAVNREHAALFWGAHKAELRWRNAEAACREHLAETPPGLQATIANAVKGLALPVGLHTVTFLQRSGYWYLLQWVPLLREARRHDCHESNALASAILHLVS